LSLDKSVRLKVSGLLIAIGIPVFEAMRAIMRLERQAKYFEMFETSAGIVALVAMGFYFRQFTRAIDEPASLDEKRRLPLPVWRMTVLGALSFVVAISHVAR
jgi:hypothetical protein